MLHYQIVNDCFRAFFAKLLVKLRASTGVCKANNFHNPRIGVLDSSPVCFIVNASSSFSQEDRASRRKIDSDHFERIVEPKSTNSLICFCGGLQR